MTTTTSWLLHGETPRCGCAGECGRAHDAGGCSVSRPAPLTVAPIDPAQVALTPLSVPPEDMRVWCADCHDMATSAAAARTRLQILVDAACHKSALGPRLSASEGHNERGAAA